MLHKTIMWSWISKKASTWWRKSTNHWLQINKNRLPRFQMSTPPSSERRIQTMSISSSLHAWKSWMKNIAHQRINREDSNQQVIINFTMGNTSCWNLELNQPSSTSYWIHHRWSRKSGSSNTKYIMPWTKQQSKFNDTATRNQQPNIGSPG